MLSRIAHGWERGIIVFVTPEAIEIRMPTLEWPHPHTPGPCSRLWKRLSWERLTDKRLVKLLDEARQLRAGMFEQCRFCHRLFPPERRYEDVCHGCAEKQLGIVH